MEFLGFPETSQEILARSNVDSGARCVGADCLCHESTVRIHRPLPLVLKGRSDLANFDVVPGTIVCRGWLPVTNSRTLRSQML